MQKEYNSLIKIKTSKMTRFPEGKRAVCKLLKSVYGLKQSSKQSCDKSPAFLKKLGFTCTDDEPCIYYNEDRSILIAFFENYVILAGKNQYSISELLKKLNGKFEITFVTESNNELSYLGLRRVQKFRKVRIFMRLRWHFWLF